MEEAIGKQFRADRQHDADVSAGVKN